MYMGGQYCAFDMLTHRENVAFRLTLTLSFICSVFLQLPIVDFVYKYFSCSYNLRLPSPTLSCCQFKMIF